jgi:hypothetical protein
MAPDERAEGECVAGRDPRHQRAILLAAGDGERTSFWRNGRLQHITDPASARVRTHA